MPDEIVQRFCVVGSTEDYIERLQELNAIGVTEFNLYAKVPDTFGLVEEIGSSIIPSFSTAGAVG